MGPNELKPRWILPSLQRPHNVKRLIRSYEEVGETDAPVTVLIHRNDPCFADYMRIRIPDEWDLVVENFRFTATDAMRWVVENYPNATAYGFLGDDIVFRTKWWRELAEAAQDLYISYPDDSVHGGQLPTHFVCGRRLIEAAGWWALPGLIHSGVDLAWYIIGLNIPGLLRYKPEVVFEHIHPLIHKSPDDAIYQFARSHLKDDDKVFQAWHKGTGLRETVMKVREVYYGQAA